MASTDLPISSSLPREAEPSRFTRYFSTAKARAKNAGPTIKAMGKNALSSIKETDTSLKVVGALGVLFTLTLVAVALASHADPGAFSDMGRSVTVGCAIGASIFAVATIAYVWLARDIDKKDKERNEQAILIISEERISNETKKVDNQEIWDNHAKAECRTNYGIEGQFHNLAANSRESEQKPFVEMAHAVHLPKQPVDSGLYYAVPLFGRYAVKDLEMSNPIMAARLPASQLKKLPQSVQDAVKNDKNVELFFEVFTDITNKKDACRNIFMHAAYSSEGIVGTGKTFEMGIFAPTNLNNHANQTYPTVTGKKVDKLTKRETTVIEKQGLPIDALQRRNVRVHEDGRLSPDNTVIEITEDRVTSFYFISKTDRKTTVAHMVILNATEEGDGQLLATACQETSVHNFVENLKRVRLENAELQDQITREFSFGEEPQVLEIN